MLAKPFPAQVRLQELHGIPEALGKAVHPLEGALCLSELIGECGGPLERRTGRQNGGDEGLRGALLRQNGHMVSLQRPLHLSLLRKDQGPSVIVQQLGSGRERKVCGEVRSCFNKLSANDEAFPRNP